MLPRNPLYPIFVKLDQLSTLLVGAGEVGYEKLFFILKSSPNARLEVVAPWVNPEIEELLAAHPEYRVTIHRREFQPSDVVGHDLVIAATNIAALNREVHRFAKEAGKLVNVADTPPLCDFYLGSIVTRGPLKIGISTNGQSPTFAKRLRQLLEASLPEEETEQLLDNLHRLRDQLGPDFKQRVQQLNDLTASLLQQSASS